MDAEYHRRNSSQNYKLKKHYSILYKTQSLPFESFSDFVKRMKSEEKDSIQ